MRFYCDNASSDAGFPKCLMDISYATMNEVLLHQPKKSAKAMSVRLFHLMITQSYFVLKTLSPLMTISSTAVVC